MKNNKVISMMMVMSLFMIVRSVQAEEMAVVTADVSASNKKAPKKTNRDRQNPEKTGKGSMHQIKADIDQVVADFKAGTLSQAQAEARLNKMPAKIAKAVEKMKQSEEHGSMWKRHETRLKEKLQAARDIVSGKAKA